jgi:ABC-type amino acid transport substrate-binding protein
VAADHIIQELKYQDQVEKLPTPLAVNDTYLVFAKSLNQKALLDKFYQALEEMKKDGSYDQLIADFQKGQ